MTWEGGIGRACVLGLLGLWCGLEEDSTGTLVAAVNVERMNWRS